MKGNPWLGWAQEGQRERKSVDMESGIMLWLAREQVK